MNLENIGFGALGGGLFSISNDDFKMLVVHGVRGVGIGFETVDFSLGPGALEFLKGRLFMGLCGVSNSELLTFRLARGHWNSIL